MNATNTAAAAAIWPRPLSKKNPSIDFSPAIVIDVVNTP
jgi:hypothetical protein